MRLCGVARKAASPCVMPLSASRCIAAIAFSASNASGLVAALTEIAKALGEPIGEGNLRDHVAQDQASGGVEPLRRHGVDDIGPGPALGLIEARRGSGRPRPGTIGTIVISSEERRGMRAR